jgi:hypothetical protein
MTLDEILDDWDKDAPIDRLELGDASIDGARLHAKWLRRLLYARMRLHKLNTELKVLKRDKLEFYTQGPTKETQALGWEVPARGMVLNQDKNTYIDADKQIIEKTLQIAYQQEICNAVDLIFVALKARGFDIGRKLEDQKLKAGH